MDLQSLDQLREADERTLAFTPVGLGHMPPEEAARYQQDVVARFELAPEVAEGTRQSFDRLRRVYAYGVLCYDLFTLVDDQALLVLEQALRDRFVDHHHGVLTFKTSAGDIETVEIKGYDVAYEFVQKRRKWRLCLPDGETMHFNGMLAGLLDWARRVGLLRGQRNLRLEETLLRLRNFVAHPTSYHLVRPLDAALTLSDLREIVNQLWGQPTPGGRLYLPPATRKIMVLAWNAAGCWQIAHADQLQDAEDVPDDWQCLVLRTVDLPRRPWDWGLDRFDAQFEATEYPTELLWGPGRIPEAAKWFAATQPEPDTVDHLDRLFVVRLDGSQLYLPMSPAAAARLPPTERTGHWSAVRADYPGDASLHVRHLAETSGTASSDACPQCPSEGRATGSYVEVMAAIGVVPATDHFVCADTSGPHDYPRMQEIQIRTTGS